MTNMKTNWTLLIGLFITVNLATAQDTLYVYQGSAELFKLETSAVDSITINYVYPGFVSYDGYLYHYVTIGTQTWMVENLRTTHYRNGETILNITDNLTWRDCFSGARCNHSNNAANGAKFGYLYNWYAVADTRNIAPPGWHVATDAEWTILTNYLSTNAGISLNAPKALASTTDWTINTVVGAIGNNLTINNSTRFNALPGGYRYSGDGTSKGLGYLGYWWTSTDRNNTPYYRYMLSDYSEVYKFNEYKGMGMSVRCVRD